MYRRRRDDTELRIGRLKRWALRNRRQLAWLAVTGVRSNRRMAAKMQPEMHQQTEDMWAVFGVKSGDDSGIKMEWF